MRLSATYSPCNLSGFSAQRRSPQRQSHQRQSPNTKAPSARVPSANVSSANVPSAKVPSANVTSANVPSATVPSAKHISNLKGIDHFDDVGPCVVLASPGMMQSGLSRELFENWCTDAKNGCIVAGYCVEGTLAKQG